MQQPRIPHWHALQHTLNYVHSTCRQGILLQWESKLVLQAFTVSDWAACPNTRRLGTRYVLMLGNSPICWKSKNILFLGLVQRLSIEPLLMLLLRLYGLQDYYMILKWLICSLSLSTMTTNLRSIKQKTLFFMSVPSTLRWIVTLQERKLLKGCYILPTFLLRVSWLMCLLRFYPQHISKPYWPD